MLDWNLIYSIVGIAALVVVVVAIVFFTNLKADISQQGGFRLEGNKRADRDAVSVTGIDKSKVDIENREQQDVTVGDVSNDSDIRIR